ncbi:hypothetical protein FHX73_18174, partial [Kitasatospora viridis]
MQQPQFRALPSALHAKSDVNLAKFSATSPVGQTSKTTRTVTSTPPWLLVLPALPPSGVRLLVEGDPEQRYGARSKGWAVINGKTTKVLTPMPSKESNGYAVTWVAAMFAVRAGWDRLQFIRVMTDSPSRAGRWAKHLLHLRGHERVIRELNRIWASAKAKAREDDGISSRSDALWDLHRLLAEYSKLAWTGQAGASDLKVLIAHWIS